MKKRFVLLLVGCAAATALIIGAFLAGKRSGWREGALEQAVVEGATAMRAGEALATGDPERAGKLIEVMLADVEGELLRFDNNVALKVNTVKPAAARYVQAEMLLQLDEYWQKHPRSAAFGQRGDERNVEKFGVGGGASMNASRAAYEYAYSNAVARAKARLGK